MLNQVVANVTATIQERSYEGRVSFLQKIAKQEQLGRAFNQLSYVNLSHLSAGTDIQDRHKIISGRQANIALVSSYNDVISGHCPYRFALDELKNSIRSAGATAQVAGITVGMCDGVVQDQIGGELALFSRDIVAQSVALSLAHNAFDGVLLLGSCENVATGMLMGAASFAHLPVAFVPAGPMQTWLNGHDKSVTRLKIAEGKLDKNALLRTECCTFHSPGVCTFLGASNAVQLVFEALGLTLPGAAFALAQSPLRNALNHLVAQNIVEHTAFGSKPNPLCQIMTAHNLVNGMVAFLASGANLNLALHLIAIAKAFGFTLLWEDFASLAKVVPVLVKLPANSKVDINDLHAAGGVPVLLQALARRHLLHEDVKTLLGGFAEQLTLPSLVLKQDISTPQDNSAQEDTSDPQDISAPNDTSSPSAPSLVFEPCSGSLNPNVLLSDEHKSFQKRADFYLVQGNLGQGLIKIPQLPPEDMSLTAPARVFNNLHSLELAFNNQELKQNLILVLRYVGPAACGMPNQSSVLGILARLKKEGFKVAFLTDGRISSSSGKLLTVVQVSPEAKRQGNLSLVEDGDIIEIDTIKGVLNLKVSQQELATRKAKLIEPCTFEQTFGRSLFNLQRQAVSAASQGACTLF